MTIVRPFVLCKISFILEEGFYLRLARYLAMTGAASRRHAEELIVQGRVKVNGEVIVKPAFDIDPEQDLVCLDGRMPAIEDKITLLLYKPTGYISSVWDPQGRPTVMELVKEIKQRIYPVGRLDFDTEGLLLMTNDGDFANLMIHPRYEMPKIYVAKVKGLVKSEEVSKLKKGVVLDDGITAPAEVKILQQNSRDTLMQIEIHEGRKRQVRRMCDAIGHPVIYLKRVAFSGLDLEGLQPGEYRYLKDEEVKKLLEMAKANKA
ncbi:MAG: rRNA pseudouridine synthase [Syntrophomonadaceae bacterium]|nr:rRNA pseudouridine synthase [Syntrophomonadaceae bacterium]